MQSILLAPFIFLLTVFLVAGIHEAGHYLAARLFNIKVLCFSIGFGKALWRKKDKRGTEYQLALLPLGGYVKLLDSREGDVAAEEAPYAFDKRSIYQRFCVLAAGPLFNFLLAVLAFWIIYVQGVVYMKPVVGDVVPHSIAARAQLQPHDEIMAINQRPILSWTAMAMALMPHYGETGRLILTVRSPSHEKPMVRVVDVNKTDWRLNELRPDLLNSFGVKPYMPSLKEWQIKRYTVTAGFLKAVTETYYFISFNTVILFKMLTGVISWRGLGGPVSIFQMVVGAAHYGWLTYLNFLAIISISIGFINLLPIPGLDGGQIVYLLYELIRGKPLSIAVQILAFRLGVILLVLLIIQTLINDLLRLK